MLFMYEKMVGLKINFMKSEIFVINGNVWILIISMPLYLNVKLGPFQ
jgi:type IV secretory pathway VirB3-like protein